MLYRLLFFVLAIVVALPVEVSECAKVAGFGDDGVYQCFHFVPDASFEHPASSETLAAYRRYPPSDAPWVAKALRTRPPPSTPPFLFIRSPEFCIDGAQCLMLSRDYQYYIDVAPPRGGESILWSMQIYLPYSSPLGHAIFQQHYNRTVSSASSPAPRTVPTPAPRTPSAAGTTTSSSPPIDLSDLYDESANANERDDATHESANQSHSDSRTGTAPSTRDTAAAIEADIERRVRRRSRVQQQHENLYREYLAAHCNSLVAIYLDEPGLLPPTITELDRDPRLIANFSGGTGVGAPEAATSAADSAHVLPPHVLSFRQYGVWYKLNGVTRNRNQDGMRVILRLAYDVIVDDIQIAGYEARPSPLFRSRCPYGISLLPTT